MCVTMPSASLLLGRRTRAVLVDVVDELDQGSHAGTRAALGRVAERLVVEGGACDVQVRPRDAVRDELLEEDAGRQRPAPPLAEVGDVGEGRVELLAQFLGHGERPHLLAGPVGGVVDLLQQVVVVGHDSRDPGAECDDARAGERGDVDDQVGAVLRGPDDGVGEHQPALGVGVEHFDGLSAVHRQHVGGTLGAARRHVLGHRCVRGDGDPWREPGQGDHGGHDCGGSAHVGLHGHHGVVGLERQPARVERDALAHERHVLLCPRRPEGDANQSRRVRRALADAEDAPVPGLGQRLLVEHVDFQFQSLGMRDGGVGECRRCEVARRRVDPATGPVHRFGDGLGTGEGRLDRLVPGLPRDHGRIAQRRLALVRLVVGEGVRAEQEPLGDGGDVVGVGHRECHSGRGRTGQCPRTDAGCPAQDFAVARRALVVECADAHGDHDGGLRGAGRRHLGHLPGLAGGTEVHQRRDKRAAQGGVDRLGPGKQAYAVVARGDDDDDGVGGDAGGVGGGQGDGGHDSPAVQS